jgi:hypothetical protein
MFFSSPTAMLFALLDKCNVAQAGTATLWNDRKQ